jgi:membrane protein
MRRVQGLLRSFDRVQQRSRWLGFPFAVMGKFGDDHGGALTTVIAYKRSSRSFPCCWSWSRCSGSCSAANPGLQQRLPRLGGGRLPDHRRPGTRQHPRLRGSGVGLAIGLVAFAWGAHGLTQVTQHAMA